MSKQIDQKTGETRYFIPIDGKLYETNEEIHKVYYSMERRERYIEERSKLHDISFDALVEAGYPVEERLMNLLKKIDDEVITIIMIEKLLSKLSVLTEYEVWLVEELYTHGKTERQIERESEIPRKTISYQKQKILLKLHKALEE